MGLLDALQGDGGGLLAFLRNNALSQQFQGVPPGDVAQYAPQSRLATAVGPQAMQGNNSPRPPDGAQRPAAAPSQPSAPMPAAQVAPPATNLFGMQPYRITEALQSLSRGGSLSGAIRGEYDDPRAQQARAQNLTARALLAKGIDPLAVSAAVQPGNTEMLKALIDQAFGKGSLIHAGAGKAFADKETAPAKAVPQPLPRQQPAALPAPQAAPSPFANLPVPMAQAPPIFVTPRQPIDLSVLRAALANRKLPQSGTKEADDLAARAASAPKLAPGESTTVNGVTIQRVN
jgi:hypothetical protein